MPSTFYLHKKEHDAYVKCWVRGVALPTSEYVPLSTDVANLTRTLEKIHTGICTRASAVPTEQKDEVFFRRSAMK